MDLPGQKSTITEIKSFDLCTMGIGDAFSLHLNTIECVSRNSLDIRINGIHCFYYGGRLKAIDEVFSKI